MFGMNSPVHIHEQGVSGSGLVDLKLTVQIPKGGEYGKYSATMQVSEESLREEDGLSWATDMMIEALTWEMDGDGVALSGQRERRRRAVRKAELAGVDISGVRT